MSKQEKKVISFISVFLIVCLICISIFAYVYRYSRIDDDSTIGTDKAVEIAMQHAGCNIDESTILKAKIDLEHGVMVYEIRFISDTVRYEYEIKAQDGTVITSQSENKEALKAPVALS